jgi:hypothetical protein
MKSLIIKLILAFIGMLIGLLLLETTHQFLPLLTGSILILAGFSYIAFNTAQLLGDYNVFEFKHYYYSDDPIKDNETYIIKRLDHNERTQLRYYNDTLFTHSPILVDDVTEMTEEMHLVSGWVKAKNENEAIRILHYTTNWEELQ